VEMELLVALAENRDAENVGGEEVGRELDALEASVDRAGERLGQRGLAGARKILEQDMAATGERGEEFAGRTRLAVHDLADIGRDLAIDFARAVKRERSRGRAPGGSEDLGERWSCGSRWRHVVFV